MIIWTPAVLNVLYACVLYFCICPCSTQRSMSHMERRSTNTLIMMIMMMMMEKMMINQPFVLKRGLQLMT